MRLGFVFFLRRMVWFENYNTFDEARVLLKEISDEEIERWIDTGHAMDKAGAYGIQNEFCAFVEKMVGNYTTIVGLLRIWFMMS